MQKLIKVIIIIVVSTWGSLAWSACWLSEGEPVIETIDLSRYGEMSFPSTSEISASNIDSYWNLKLIDYITTPKNTVVSCDKSDYFYMQGTAEGGDQQIVPAPPFEGDKNQTFIKFGVNGLALGMSNYDNNPPKRYIYCNYYGTECTATNAAGFRFWVSSNGIVEPGVIHGSSLPTLSLWIGQPGNMVLIHKVSFTGTIVVHKPTCQTPDVTVDLGKWDISDFHGINSTTEWRNASIELTNCGKFAGYTRYIHTNKVTGVDEITGLDFNHSFIRLTPMYGAINEAQGIAAIQPGDLAADGVGIQVAYNSYNNIQPFDFNSLQTHNFRNNVSPGTVIIPLLARYIQTKDTVSPGKADSKIQFTITYK